MLISKIDVRPVSVPYKEPVAWRFGVLEGVTTAVVRIATDNGLEGLGEAPGIPTIGIVLQALDFFGSSLIGEDPRRVRQQLHRAAEGGAHHFPYVANVALAALEMALWDLCGKTLGCPVYQLFGGITAETIPFYWHVNLQGGSTESAVAHGLVGVRQGFRTLYLKGGSDVDRDLRHLEALRSELGTEVELRVDPNEGWGYLGALKHLERIESLRLEFLEQPFGMHELERMREFRKRARVPVAANQSAWFVKDVADVIATRAADVIVTGIYQAGGMVSFGLAEEMCRVGSVPLVRHSLCDLGIGTAAAVQVLASRPGFFMAHQTHLQLVEHDLLESPWEFVDGSLAVRSGPGLGVEVDVQALERYARKYAEAGEYKGYMLK